MSIASICAVLERHFINYKLVNGRLLAESVYTQGGVTFSEWLDVTNWSKRSLMMWLGY